MSVKNIFNDEDEQDDRWSAVDAYTISHLHPSSRSNSKTLVHSLENSLDQGLPDISNNPTLGKFIALQCQIGQVTHALEIGTLGGYTSIWIATQNPQVHVTTIEISPEHARVARENIEHAGVSDRVEVIIGPGLDVLEDLKKDVRDGRREKFEFVFIDADKINYLNYFNASVDMCEKGSCIVVDNMVKSGAVAIDKEDNPDSIVGPRMLIEAAGKDKRVDALVMQIVSEKTYDGFLVAVVL